VTVPALLLPGRDLATAARDHPEGGCWRLTRAHTGRAWPFVASIAILSWPDGLLIV
jgi:hypothetical protein